MPVKMYLVSIPIISLDKIYTQIDYTNTYFLDCTRMDNSKKLVSRMNPNDSNSVGRQIQELSNLLKEKNIQEIIILDDVVFTGSVLRTIINEFNNNGIKVIGIRAGISSTEGYNYFNNNLPLGLKCGYLMSTQVIDQICERDFYFGIAGSGISILQGKEIVKSPYFRPFGKPVERSSVPSNEELKFSLSCLKRSLLLWQEIERLNKRRIQISELPEKIIYTDEKENIVKTLKKGMNKICIK